MEATTTATTPTLAADTAQVAATAAAVARAVTSSATITTITKSAQSMANDGSFGPKLGSRFDFTLSFEHIIFTLLPTGLLIAACPLYIYYKRNDQVQVNRGRLFWAKICCAIVLFFIQIAQLVLWTTIHQTSATVHWAIAASSVSAFAAVCTGFMLNTEHRQTIQPSTILSIYFAISVILDIIKARSYLLRVGPDAIGAVQIIIAATKATLLVLQEMPKDSLLKGKKIKTILGKEAMSGFWTRSLALWINQTFFIGFRTILTIRDLGNLSSDFLTETLATRFNKIWIKEDRKRSLCLMRATFRVCYAPFLLSIIPRLLFSACSLSQPFLIYRAIEIIGSEDVTQADKVGVILATLVVYGGMAIFRSMYTSLNDRTTTLARGVLTGKICSKTFHLPAKEAARGAALTLTTADIDAVVQGALFCHTLWVSCVELGFVMYFLWLFVGYSCFLLLIPTILAAFWTVYFGPLVGAAQKKWNEKIAERVGQTTRILAQAKQVKTLGYQTSLTQYIQRLRLIEIYFSRRYRAIHSFIVVMSMAGAHLTPVIIVAGTLFLRRMPLPLNSNKLFAILAVVQLSALPLQHIVAMYAQLSSLVSCFGRIEEFILMQEKVDDRQHTRPSRQECSPALGVQFSDPAFTGRPIDLLGASLGPEDRDVPILHNVDVVVPRGALAIAYGPNSSGKSTFLKGLIGEGCIHSGHVYVDRGSVAYCGQTAWLRNATIRENILGYLPFNLQWYHTVLRCCSLTEDLQQLPDDDRTMAGNDGAKLSGGQRHRIALARALYSKAQIIVLDDIFSALDIATGREVFAALFNKDGIIRQLGTTVVLATHRVEFHAGADILLRFDKQRRSISMKKGQSAQIDSRPTHIAFQMREPVRNDEAKATEAEERFEAMAGNAQLYHKSDFGLYKFFFLTISNRLFVLFIITTTITTICERMPGIFMRWWLQHMPYNKTLFSVYAALGASPVLSYLGMALVFYQNIVPQYAANMHEMLVKSMFGATVPYLTSTDHGALINRISQYMTLITQQFARDFFRLPYAAMCVIADIIIIASASYYAIIMVPIIAVVLYCVQLVYLRTSRQLRLLDLEAKTPMYGILAEAGSGIEHMRAFGWEAHYMNHMYQVLDNTQKPFYFLACVQRWLNLVMDGINTCIALILMCFAVFWGDLTTESGIGLSFVTLMGLGNIVTFFMIQWVAIETSLGSIASVQSFVKETPTEKDSDSEKDEIPDDWLIHGVIEFKDVTAKYSTRERSFTAFKNVDMSAGKLEKVAIKGRTGSGKSSIFLTLLNCLEYTGSITIDGYELRDIPLGKLRTRIGYCPQENLVLPVTIRENLMPWILGDGEPKQVHEFGVAGILDALDLVEVIDAAGGLDAPMAGLGLSAGESQMFSLARTMLNKIFRGTRIILMDEVTSQIAEANEDMVAQAIDAAFHDCTVITVAHRLNTIEEADRVYEMKKGVMKSCDKRPITQASNTSNSTAASSATSKTASSSTSKQKLQSHAGPSSPSSSSSSSSPSQPRATAARPPTLASPSSRRGSEATTSSQPSRSSHRSSRPSRSNHSPTSPSIPAPLSTMDDDAGAEYIPLRLVTAISPSLRQQQAVSQGRDATVVASRHATLPNQTLPNTDPPQDNETRRASDPR